MQGIAGRRYTKRLSTRAHAAILKRLQERDHYAQLVEALNQSIERIIEQDTKVNLDTQNWTLCLEEGLIERIVPLKELSHAE